MKVLIPLKGVLKRVPSAVGGDNNPWVCGRQPALESVQLSGYEVLKFLPVQLLFLLQSASHRKNILLLVKFLCFLLGTIALYSILFHHLMQYEGREYSWITGLYWTLTVMSTLGFGDITFESDLGRLFSILVLSTGVIMLLIMFPFFFIQFLWAPWTEAQARSRTPRSLPPGTSGHTIITSFDPIIQRLVAKLKQRHRDYVLVIADPQQAGDLHDAGYRVILGEPDDPETYRRLRLEDAAVVLATNNDLINTSIAFTVRGITAKVPIITSADNDNSLDILQFPPNTKVFQFARMLGHSLAERTIGLGRPINVVSRFDSLLIAEISAVQTSLGGKTLAETDLRRQTGVTVIGLWEKGLYEAPRPDSRISSTSLLLLAGTAQQLDRFEACYAVSGETGSQDRPVLILGGGRVGQAAVEVLARYDIEYRIIDKRPLRASIPLENFIQGDAADLQVLERAGVREARTAIITTHDDAMNVYLTFYCRQLRPEIQIITRATSERSVAKMHMAGADLVLSYASMGANNIINAINTEEISMFTEGLNIFRRPVPAPLVGKSLAESGIREKTGCSVIAIKMDNELSVAPDPGSPLRNRQELILIGTTMAEQTFLDLY